MGIDWDTIQDACLSERHRVSTEVLEMLCSEVCQGIERAQGVFTFEYLETVWEGLVPDSDKVDLVDPTNTSLLWPGVPAPLVVVISHLLQSRVLRLTDCEACLYSGGKGPGFMKPGFPWRPVVLYKEDEKMFVGQLRTELYDGCFSTLAYSDDDAKDSLRDAWLRHIRSMTDQASPGAISEAEWKDMETTICAYVVEVGKVYKDEKEV